MRGSKWELLSTSDSQAPSAKSHSVCSGICMALSRPGPLGNQMLSGKENRPPRSRAWAAGCWTCGLVSAGGHALGDVPTF